MKYVLLALVLFIFLALAWSAYKLRDRVEIIGEFLAFLRERKLWWIMPLVLVFILAGLFIAVTAGSGVGVFLYVLH